MELGPSDLAKQAPSQLTHLPQPDPDDHNTCTGDAKIHTKYLSIKNIVWICLLISLETKTKPQKFQTQTGYKCWEVWRDRQMKARLTNRLCCAGPKLGYSGTSEAVNGEHQPGVVQQVTAGNPETKRRMFMAAKAASSVRHRIHFSFHHFGDLAFFSFSVFQF